MNIFSSIVSGLLGLLVVAFALLLVIAIVFNVKGGKRYRQGMARELERLRLAKMLSALGVDVNSYLHSERVVDIENQMSRCSACGQTAECDERIAGGDVDAEKIGFCDNETSLRDLLKKDRGTASAGQ